MRLVWILVLAALARGGLAAASPLRAPGAAGDRPRTAADVLSELIVVEATVTKVRPRADLSDEGGTVADVLLEVTKVYSGRGVKPGDPFSAIAADGTPGFLSDTRSLQVPQPIPKVGDVAIWQLNWTRDGGALRGNRNNNDGVVVLPLLGHEGELTPGELKAAPKLAEALRDAAEAPDDAERVRRLGDAARRGSAETAEAVCRILERADAAPGRLPEARRLFVDEHVPIAARTELDGMISRSDAGEWTRSPDRMKAFVHMARDARTEAEFRAIGERLYDGAEDGKFSMAQCLEVLDAERANPRFVSECGQLFTAIEFAIAPHSAGERDVAFQYFARLLKFAENDKVRRAAAGAIAEVGRRAFGLTDDQLAAVRQMRKDARDQQTIELLDEALAIPAAKRARQTQPAH